MKCITWIGKNHKIILTAFLVFMLVAVVYRLSSMNDEDTQHYTRKPQETLINEALGRTQGLQNKLEARKKPDDTDIRREYTGTIPPYTYVADIIEIDLDNNSIKGITSNIDNYSGLMEFRFIDNSEIQDIKLYNTYSIVCEPLIHDKTTIYVKAISISESTEEERQQMYDTKKEVSMYIKFQLKHYNSSLVDIIKEGNEEFYTWTNNDILNYQEWIRSLGYTEEFEVVSTVKTLEQLKDEQ